MRRRRGRSLSLALGLALLAALAAPVAAAPVPFTGDQSLPVTRFTTTVTDTSRGTRCTERGVDLPHRTLYVQVAHPTTGSGHPVLLFAHGMRGDPDLMEAELEGWARKGYVAVAPRFPLGGRYSPHGWDCGWADIANTNGDLRFVLDQLAARTGDFARIPAGVADTDRVGASGISSGGIAVFLFYDDCCDDPRIRAVDTQLAGPVLSLEAWRWAELPIPLLMVNERDDPLVPLREARVGFDAATGPKHLVTLPGGDPHSSSLPRPDTPTEVWEMRERLFDLHLLDDPAARPRLVHAFDAVPARYTYELSIPLVGSTPVHRVAGGDRIETAIATSNAAFPAGGAAAAALASSASHADALAGVPLAAAVEGSLLLSPTDRVDERVRRELRRLLRPGATVHLLGGPAALAPAVAADVASMGFQVERHGGVDRFETATKIADRLGRPETVLVTDGIGFPDALAAGAAAAHLGGALVLTDGQRLPAASDAYLRAHTGRVFAIGGPAAAAVGQAIPVVGRDRYSTAVEVARAFFSDPPATVGVASGEAFPDALAAGAHLARLGAPLLLSPRAPAPGTVLDHAASAARVYLYGGQLAVAESVRIALNEAPG